MSLLVGSERNSENPSHSEPSRWTVSRLRLVSFFKAKTALLKSPLGMNLKLLPSIKVNSPALESVATLLCTGRLGWARLAFRSWERIFRRPFLLASNELPQSMMWEGTRWWTRALRTGLKEERRKKYRRCSRSIQRIRRAFIMHRPLSRKSWQRACVPFPHAQQFQPNRVHFQMAGSRLS